MSVSVCVLFFIHNGIVTRRYVRRLLKIVPFRIRRYDFYIKIFLILAKMKLFIDI